MTRHFPAFAHAAATPNARAVSVDGDARTWNVLIERSGHLQTAWTSALTEHTRVLLVAHRSLRFFEHFTALIRAGVTVVLLAPDTPDEERARIQQRAGATRLLDIEAWDRVEAQANAQNDRALEQRQQNTASQKDAPQKDVPHKGAQQNETPPSAAPWNAERTLFAVMSSGTTGAPRPIDVTCEQVIFSTLGSAARLGSLPNDRWHAPLPLHHVGGIMVFLRALILGFEAEYTTTFDAAHSAERVMSGEVTLVSLVPVMLSRMFEHAPALYAPAPLRAILLGGAAAPNTLLRNAEAAGLPIARSWGMSETASQIATAPPGDFNAWLSPLPFAQITADEEILHIQAPQAQGGALRSTDRGAVRKGKVEIHGRADDIFISGGENIDPLEIERVLLQHPDIRDVLVFGAPSPQWGHAVAVFIVSDDATDRAATIEPDKRSATQHSTATRGSTLDRTTLQAWCADRLSRHKRPKIVHFVQDIPRNPLGKPSRKRALELHTSMMTQHTESSPHTSSGATS